MILKEAKFEEVEKYGMKVMNSSVRKEVYDDKYAIVFRYERQGLSGFVHVDDYCFFFTNKMIEITISYRLSESPVWKEDFSAIPATFSFK